MLFEPIQKLALALSQERSLSSLLKSIVHEIAKYPGVALVRVWLAVGDEECEICRHKSERAAAGRVASLHMFASAGHSLEGKEAPWSAIEGDFHIGSPKVRHIVDSGKPLLIREVATTKAGLKGPIGFTVSGWEASPDTH